MSTPTARTTVVVVLSGPSGSGKTTLAGKLLRSRGMRGVFARSVSLTTRPRRTGERNGRDYFFISEREFFRLKAAKKVLEWTKYLGYYYATSKEYIDNILESGRSVLLCLDHKGARAIKRIYRRKAVTVFVMPPGLRVLRERIASRCARTSEKEIASRLAMADEEMKNAGWFDYRVVNDTLPDAARRLREIVAAAVSGKVRER